MEHQQLSFFFQKYLRGERIMMFINSQWERLWVANELGVLVGVSSHVHHILSYMILEPAQNVLYNPFEKGASSSKTAKFSGFPCWFFQEGDRIKHLWKKKTSWDGSPNPGRKHSCQLPSTAKLLIALDANSRVFSSHSSAPFFLANASLWQTAIFQCITTPQGLT